MAVRAGGEARVSGEDMARAIGIGASRLRHALEHVRHHGRSLAQVDLRADGEGRLRVFDQVPLDAPSRDWACQRLAGGPGHSVTITRSDHPLGLVRAAGLQATSDYLDTGWLPVLGPTAAEVMRLGHRLAQQRTVDEVTVTEEYLRVSLRLPKPAAPGRSGALQLAMERIERSGLGTMAAVAGGTRLTLWRHLPPVPHARLAGFPAFVRLDHYDAMEAVDRRMAALGLDLGAVTDVGRPSERRPAPAPPPSTATTRAWAALGRGPGTSTPGLAL